MNLDEFSYLNQQLAGMLKAGIPLEGALRQLCGTMRPGVLQAELVLLEADLARGLPLRQALPARQLPEFYKQMVLVGVEGNDLPALLTLLADHYQRLHHTWTRLKGLLFYPLLVLAVSLAVSVLVAVLFTRVMDENMASLRDMTVSRPGQPTRLQLVAGLWGPVVLLGMVGAATAVMLGVPGLRRRLQWRVPGFREASLSHVASSLALMLQNGSSLDGALGVLDGLETGTPLQPELARWRARLAGGQSRFADLSAGGVLFPPLFVWLVAASGEDLVGGLRQAARVYYERAVQRVDGLLYAALPVSVLVLALLILGQMAPILRVFGSFMEVLGSLGE